MGDINLNQEMQRFEQELNSVAFIPRENFDEAEFFLRKQTFNVSPQVPQFQQPRHQPPQPFTQFVPHQIKNKNILQNLYQEQFISNQFLQYNQHPNIYNHSQLNFQPPNIMQFPPPNYTPRPMVNKLPSPPKVIAAPSVKYDITISEPKPIILNDKNNPLAYTIVPRNYNYSFKDKDTGKVQTTLLTQPNLIQSSSDKLVNVLQAPTDSTNKLTKNDIDKNKKKKKKNKKSKDGVKVKSSSSSVSMPPKHKVIVRYDEGSCWMDSTLLDWDPNDYRIFCGDLGNEVTDEVLARAFNRYPSFQRAKVVRDKRNNKTKGYGFVSFKDALDYAKAMKEMNGRYVGGRPIKLRKSIWQDRSLNEVRKKVKDKQKLVNQIKAL